MKIIEGFTSNQEIRASVWESAGKEKVFQLACNVYLSEKMAEKVYGKNCYRKVKITLSQIKNCPAI